MGVGGYSEETIMLRDRFAIELISAIVSSATAQHVMMTPKTLAQDAYEYADALVAERMRVRR